MADLKFLVGLHKYCTDSEHMTPQSMRNYWRRHLNLDIVGDLWIHLQLPGHNHNKLSYQLLFSYDVLCHC